MIDRQHRTTTVARATSLLTMLALLVTGWFGATPRASAQGTIPLTIAAKSCDGSGVSGSCWNEIGAQFTVTTQDGVFLGSCTLEGPPNVGVVLSCVVPVPDGLTVVVTEDVSTITPGYEPEENPIIFDTAKKPSPPNVPSFWGPIFHNGPSARSVSTRTSDIAIAPTENGQPVTDACFVLVDYSNIGCDENRDGLVTFADIPLGTYTVRQTTDLGPGRSVSDFTIQVAGNIGPAGHEVFPALVNSTGGSTVPDDSVDIALITRDPQDGHLLTDTCYVLVDYSNEGCDENADGQVTFAAIPAGTYTVRQTRVPAGYPQVHDFQIHVQAAPGGASVPLGYVVRQAEEQNAPNTRNVSVILLDSRTNEKVTSSTCVEFIGASNVGCDQDLVDGQIDFLDVPAGTWEARFSNLPPGWHVLGPGMVGPSVTIDAGAGSPTHQFEYFQVYTGSGNTGGGGSAGNTNATALTGAGTSAIGPSGAGGTGSATVLMTFRGCPEGFNPNVGNFYAECTIPLDAPDASIIVWGGDGQGGMSITGLDRQYNGAYIYNAGPATMNLQLSGMAPIVRDAYQVVGADWLSGDIYTVNLANGETREIFVFYYFE